jgi:DnaJ-class molecular chaperone
MATLEQTDDLTFTHQSLDRVDYFTVLGLKHGASSEQVREGFHQFALKYHPDQWVDEPEWQAQALTVFKRGTEAYRVLMHAVLRARYEQALRRGELRLAADEMFSGAEGPAATAEVALPSGAKPFYEKAVASLEKGDINGAKMHLMLAKSRGNAPQFDVLQSKIDAYAKDKSR